MDAMEMLPGTDCSVCACCGQPVRRGQARWAGDPHDRSFHWTCAERMGLTRSAHFRAALMGGPGPAALMRAA
ncbi:MAG TPA: hypothetical protein VEH84_18515 [Alphaproteobacteria bacterium]|nr:hypothetical protein [Alphaproteobacteria bacterium]